MAPSTNLYTIFLLSSRRFYRWCLFRHPTPTTLARFRSSSPAIHFRSSSPANEKGGVAVFPPGAAGHVVPADSAAHPLWIALGLDRLLDVSGFNFKSENRGVEKEKMRI
ncbi:hypothetical protein E3N88_33129 [Mikania micrantha]|uniref:Uncharacterized protein n=1 Tax=Mikania micrantha TaxID=192012 RepID=A0A5N6MAE8_9ASTR|nr:hypothetical protein E3N88_33129 [Mikania micrantha]